MFYDKITDHLKSYNYTILMLNDECIAFSLVSIHLKVKVNCPRLCQHSKQQNSRMTVQSDSEPSLSILINILNIC